MSEKITHFTGLSVDNAGTIDPDTNGEIRYVTGTGFRFQQEGTVYTFVTSSGTGVAGSLDAAYSIGREISLDEGAMVLNDATAAAVNTLEFSKTGAGTGNLINLTSDTTYTGNFIGIDMDTAVGAQGIYIDGGGGTRTADLVSLKHDGSGNNNALTITATATGSGSLLELLCNADGAEDGCINIDMNTAVSAEAVYLDAGGGARDANLIEIKNDHSGNVDVFSIVDTATSVGSGSVFDINMDGNGSGSVIDCDMNAALGEEFLYLDAGAKTRTANLIDVKYDGAGAVDFMAIVCTDTSSGHIFDIDMGATHTGNVIDIDMNLAVAASALYLDVGGATRTADLIGIKSDGDGNADVIGVTDTATGAGHILNIAMGGNGGGAVINVDMNLAVDEEFLILDIGAGTRTANAFEINNESAGNMDLFAITDVASGNGSVFDIDMTANGGGSVFNVDMNAALDEEFLLLDAGNKTRTADLISVTNDGGGNVDFLAIVDTNTGSGSLFDISMDGNGTGSTITCDMNLAVGEEFLYLDGGAGTRTVDMIDVLMDGNGNVGVLDVTVTNTGSGNILEIDVDAAHTGTLLLMSYGTSAATGDAVNIDMGTCVTGSALVLAAAGIRTDDLIKIDDASTGNAAIFDINFTAVYTGNCLDVTYGTAAATGNAIDLNMGTNVAGMAVSVASAATGTAHEGAALDVKHTGDLGANADCVRIASTGNISSTSALLSLDQGTGAGTTGSVALHINAAGTNVEAITVAAGNVSLGGDLAVTGATTLGTTLYKDLTETVTAADVITAAQSGSVFFLDYDAESTHTLPVEAAGLHYTFIVSDAPASASYTVVTHDGGDTIHGHAVSSADAGGSADSTAGTQADTITFVDSQAVEGDMVQLWCDGTSWFALATMGDEDAITFTAT